MDARSPRPKRSAVAPEVAARIPPGQFLTERWPVLHDGSVPLFDPASWDFRVFGLVERPIRLSLEEVRELPRITITGDMHCVTRWSKLGNVWEGVSFRTIVELVAPLPEARFVVFHADGGYTANLPIEAVAGGDALLALQHSGEELTPEHGYPLRVVVPGRYAWKSAKWLRAVEFVAEDRPGFWERYGYHRNADPWHEERFAE